MAPRFELPDMHALYKPLFLGVVQTYKYDGKSSSCLGYVCGKVEEIFEDAIKVLVIWLWVNQKVIIWSRPDLIHLSP